MSRRFKTKATPPALAEEGWILIDDVPEMGLMEAFGILKSKADAYAVIPRRILKNLENGADFDPESVINATVNNGSGQQMKLVCVKPGHAGESRFYFTRNLKGGGELAVLIKASEGFIISPDDIIQITASTPVQPENRVPAKWIDYLEPIVGLKGAQMKEVAAAITANPEQFGVIGRAYLDGRCGEGFSDTATALDAGFAESRVRRILKVDEDGKMHYLAADGSRNMSSISDWLEEVRSRNVIVRARSTALTDPRQRERINPIGTRSSVSYAFFSNPIERSVPVTRSTERNRNKGALVPKPTATTTSKPMLSQTPGVDRLAKMMKIQGFEVHGISGHQLTLMAKYANKGSQIPARHSIRDCLLQDIQLRDNGGNHFGGNQNRVKAIFNTVIDQDPALKAEFQRRNSRAYANFSGKFTQKNLPFFPEVFIQTNPYNSNLIVGITWA